MICFVALLLWGKSTPAVVFILLPIIVGFAVGFTAEEMSGYIASGVSGVATTAILFIFAVLFFGVMNDAGVFDVIVGKVLKLVGNNITLLMFATVLIAFIGHLDGSGATTLLICIPPLLPIYKKMNVRPINLQFSQNVHGDDGMNGNTTVCCLYPAAYGGIFTNTTYFSRREHGL